MAKTAKPVLFTVFYDGGCSICRTRIAIYKMEARRADLAIEQFASLASLTGLVSRRLARERPA